MRRNKIIMFKKLIQHKYRIVIILIIIAGVLSSCSPEDNQQGDANPEPADHDKKIEELNNKIETLEDDLEEANQRIEDYKKEDENFPFISNLALDFVRAHTQGNKEKMRELLSEEIELVEKDKRIYAVMQVNDQEVEWMLYEKDSPARYQDMVVQGYAYLREEDAFIIHIREFYEGKEGEVISPPTFLNLTFKKVDDQWKIINLEFDV